MDGVIDCRSPEGITVGLIDAIIAAAHALQGRDLSSPAVQEALKDLAGDKELRFLLEEKTLPDNVYLLSRFYSGSQRQLDKIVYNNALIEQEVKEMFDKYPDGWFSVVIETWTKNNDGRFFFSEERRLNKYGHIEGGKI